MLFDVKPYDPLTYAAVVCVLVLVGMKACYVPARRVDPCAILPPKSPRHIGMRPSLRAAAALCSS